MAQAAVAQLATVTRTHCVTASYHHINRPKSSHHAWRTFIKSDRKSVKPSTNPMYDVATANSENTCATCALVRNQASMCSRQHPTVLACRYLYERADIWRLLA